MINSIPTVTNQPSQFFDGSDEQKKLDWLLRWGVFVASHYNRPNNTLSNSLPGYKKTSSMGLVQRMYRAYSYMMGLQENGHFKNAVDELGNQLGTNLIPGQKITQMVRHIQGRFETMITGLDVTVQATTKEILDRKAEKKEKLEMYFDEKENLAMLEELGISFRPEGAADVKSKEDIEERMATQLEKEEVRYNDIAVDCWKRNRIYEKALITGGLQTPILGTACFTVSVEGGYTKVRCPDPTRIVWDTANGFDPQNHEMQFYGEFDAFTPLQVIDMFEKDLLNNYGQAEVDKIKNLTSENFKAAWPDANFSTGNFEWCSNSNGMIKMSVFKAYWIAADELIDEDAPYYVQKKEANRFGYKAYVKAEDSDKPKSAGQCVYEATIINGLYVVRAGKMKNQIYDPYLDTPTIPAFVFNSSIFLGEVSSIVDQLIQTQDRLDYLNNYLSELISTNLGKIFVFRRSQIGDSKLESMFADAKAMRIMIAEDTTGEEIERLVNLGQAIDLSNSNEIKDYLYFRDAEERAMESILGISSIAMGSQDDYVSKGVQSKTLDINSASTSYLFTGYITFLEKVMQYATDIGHLIYQSGDEYRQLEGKTGARYIKEGEGSGLSFKLYIKLNDAINAQQRESLMAFALMLAQQPGQLDAEDMIELMTSKTFSRLKAHFKKSIKRKKEEAKEIAGQQAMEAKIMEQERLASENNREAARLETATVNNNTNAEMGLAKEMIKQDAKQQPAA